MSNNQILIKYANGELVQLDSNTIEGLAIEFLGKNSQVIIGEGSIFRNSWIKIEDNSVVHIEKTAPRGINNTGISMSGSPSSKLFINSGFSSEGCYFGMVNESRLDISIGKQCMFSTRIVFSATDGHCIFDASTKKLLNRAKPISIGSQVWIGHSVTILKGTTISDDSIIGTGSVVAKVFTEKNIIVAGNPAKIIKRNINWSRQYIDQYHATENYKPYNLLQIICCYFFGYMFRPFISQKQLSKLKNTPVDFFYDSRHPFTRSFGKFFRLF